MTNAKWHTSGYGVATTNGTTLEVGVTGSAKITFVTSQYNTSGKVISVTSSDATGTIDESGISECKVGADGDKLTVTYTAGNEANATLTFSFTGTVYVPALIIEPIKEEVYLAKGTTTKVIFTGAIDAGNAGNYTDDLNDLKGTYAAQVDYLGAADLKHADEAVVLSRAKYHGTSYGLYVPAGETFDINVAGSATITMVGSTYSDAGNITASSSDAAGSFDNASVSTKPETDKGNITIKYTGDSNAKLTLTFGANTYVGNIIVTVDEARAPVVLDTSKIDVWDFGAEALDAEKYNNNLTVDVINGFYPGVAGGTAGKNIASFTAKDAAGKDAVKFNDGGYSATHRLRTTNTALTRYDEKSLTDADSNVYSGYIYSNKGSSADVNIMVYLYEGDILTAYLASNSGDALYKLVGPDSKDYATFDYAFESGKAKKATFYAASEGWYKLYCSNEKLVCARILREHVPTVTVSGSISVPGTIPNDYKLVFVNNTTKKVTEATVTGSNYTVDLNGKYDYTVALENANGFVVNAECNALTLGTEAKAHNVTVQAVDLVNVSGSITGLEDKISDMELTFTSENVYVPEFSVNTENNTYTLKLEKDVTYAVTADGVNDYALNTTSISASADGAKNIEFTKKPVYPVAVHVVGVSDTTGATVTFKNINEEGYNYTFGIEENVSLRDGQYKVVIAGIATAPVVQCATADAIVNGEATEVTIPLEYTSSWDFAKLAAATESNEVTIIDGKSYYVGLKLSGSVKEHNNVYLYAKANNGDATITVPNVKKGSIVTIKYCYAASFTAGDKVIDEKSGKTGQIDSVAVTAAEDGDFVITTTAGTNASETYFCAIEVKETGDYRSTLHVGADKEFNTINDALAAVRKMTRTSEQAVTIKVDPGNYEEMLVIDIPDIRLVNASATPSIALKDKGVGIDANAVRVTWYYGHGYTYYSMGSDCKYDAELLAANKANGYASFVNPGSGTTNGSYWNASVVVTADNFVADGIIFENSFNQYVSAASVDDVIEAQSSAKEGSVKRAEMKTVGDTKVQEKEYVERAAALAIYNNVKKVYFNNCKFVGRQDTLYGGTGVTAAFNKCDILGGTDYIFGGMTAVFKECNLVFNTNDQTSKGEKDDVGYITAPQQSSGRGYLMYECHVTSTTPGVDTASLHTSKPGYLGRPWQANTSEAVFYKTTVDAADSFWNSGDYSMGQSLISGVAWLTTLGGQSPLCGEYGTIEKSGVDNSANRATWSKVFATPQLTDGSPISIETFLGSWNPFGLVIEDDEEITVVPNRDGAIPVEGVVPGEGTVFVNESGVVVTDGTIVVKADEIAPADKTVMETEVEAKIDTTQFDISGVSYIDINAYMGNAKVNVRTGKLTMTVEIPSSITYDPAKHNVKVLHKTAAGIVEHTVTKGTGRQISFEVSSLSPFAIVVYSEKAVTPSPSDDDSDDDKQETATTAPTVPVTPVAPVVPTESATEAGTEENVGSAETGDRAPIALFMLLAVLSAGALAVTSKKRV